MAATRAAYEITENEITLGSEKAGISYSKIVDADIDKTPQGRYDLRFVYVTDSNVEVLGRQTKQTREVTLPDLAKDAADELVQALRAHSVGLTDYSGGDFSSRPAVRPQINRRAQPA